MADNIDTGIRLARKYRQSLRIVTLEGDLINPGGAMSGGAFKNSSNLLSRRREIEELEKTVARLKTELQKSEAEVAAAKEKRTALYAKVEEIQQELQNDYVVQNTAKMNLDQVKSRQMRPEKIQKEFMRSARNWKNRFMRSRKTKNRSKWNWRPASNWRTS